MPRRTSPSQGLSAVGSWASSLWFDSQRLLTGGRLIIAQCKTPCCFEHGVLFRCAYGARMGAYCNAISTRSEEHTSELQSLMRISYAVFCLKQKNTNTNIQKVHNTSYQSNY